MSSPILTRCLECGNEWMAKPQHLLRGHRCRKCALKHRDCKHNKRKTTDQFIEEMKNKNPSIIIEGEYRSAHEKIRCMCGVCGNIWDAKPTNLLIGNGCPQCGIASIKSKQIKGKETLISQLKDINPDVQIIGEYVNYHSNILCRCKKCGNIWKATPTNLIAGTSCPIHKSSRGERSIREWLRSNDIDFVEQKKFSELTGVGGRPLPYDFYIGDSNVLIEFQGEFHDHSDRLQTDDDFVVRKRHDKLKKEYACNNGFKFYEIWYYQNISEELQKIFNIVNPVTTTVA